MGLLCARGGSILTIDDQNYSLQQFYAQYPKKQWATADSTQREKMYMDFIKRELCIIDAKKLGFESDPSLAVKIRTRSNQLLVNETYEQLVALPLISPIDIAEARMFARLDLFISHILIGYSDSYLANPPVRTIDEALLLAQNIKTQFLNDTDFSILAEKYSDDPSVVRNAGSLGWVQWGETVSEFQSAAFRLDNNVLSDPVMTNFGYHLILITDRRPSDYQNLSDEEYESVIINISKSSVRDKLRNAAIVYDSLQISEHDVYFNADVIKNIVDIYKFKQKDNAINNSGGLNVVDLLESFTKESVVCVYGGKGFGVLWFANKIKQIPSSRQPSLDSIEGVISVFRTIILQDIAYNKGASLGIDTSFTYLNRRNGIISSILYDAYLKHLVNTAPKPDSSDVKQYYNKNMEEKYMSHGAVLIREIRVKSRDLADSLLLLIDNDANFDSLAQKYSLVNPNKGGLTGPLSRNDNRALYDAAMLLEIGSNSPVIPAPNNQFSFISLVEKVPSTPLAINRVYSRIESLLINENQIINKKTRIDYLFDEYKVQRHLNLLN